MADANLKIDTTLLDGLIVGRVEPHIYAFSTETVPNYLKVGDTTRGVLIRLDEWKKIFPNLVQQYEHSAQIDEETIFRDFAVHTYLEQEKGRTRLLPDTFGLFSYPSSQPCIENPETETTGLTHLAFEIDDMTSAMAELDRQRIPHEEIRIDKYTGKHFVFFHDPDGMPVELYEK